MSIYTIFTTFYSIFQLGWTTLHCASWCNKHACIRLLISRGADSEIKDNEGKTALEVAGDGELGTKEKDEETRAVIRQALVSRQLPFNPFVSSIFLIFRNLTY